MSHRLEARGPDSASNALIKQSLHNCEMQCSMQYQIVRLPKRHMKARYPNIAVVGDSASVLKGCLGPFILLQRKDGYFTVLGDS
jgi:hypothetical protein